MDGLPSAAPATAVDVRGGTTVHGHVAGIHVGGRRPVAQVRRDVGSALSEAAVLGGVLRVLEGKVSHVQLVGHVGQMLLR